MRPDISDQLTHFTSSESDEGAFTNLCNIVDHRGIRGGTASIRGGYPCVCFTEAPLNSLPGGFVNPAAYSRYSPFGIILDKHYLFDLGARPVIYGPAEEFHMLPGDMRWRHMRYEPTSSPPTDFTWERDWRLRVEELPIGPDVAGIVVPGEEWGQRLVDAHEEQQEWLIQEYSLILDSSVAEQYREDFRWKIYVMK